MALVPSPILPLILLLACVDKPGEDTVDDTAVDDTAVDDTAADDTAADDTAADDTAVEDTAVDDTGEDCDLSSMDLKAAFTRILDGTASRCEVALYEYIVDDRAKGPGPWWEDLFVAPIHDRTLIDLSDAVSLRTKAAVPEIHIGDDGRYYLFFLDGDPEVGKALAKAHSNWFATHGLIGYGAFRLWVSDDGLAFEEEEDFGIEGLVPAMVVDPDVVDLPDGRHRMYFIGLTVDALVEPDAWEDGAPHQVWYAESDDLVHWTQVGVAVEGPFADPTVWCVDDNACMMASTGIDRSVSTDGGASFAFEGSWMVGGFAPEYNPIVGDAVRMFYNAKVDGGPIRSLRSEDGGRNWVEEAGDRLPAWTAEAVSIADAPDTGWLMYYHYWQEGHEPESHGLAKWKPYPPAPAPAGGH